jgi:hypothetical protein
VRVLTGMGGIGKTTLARSYTQYHNSRHGGTVCWIDAENIDLIDVECRRELAVHGLRDVQQIQDAVSAVHALLAARSRPWVLVLDNVAKPEDVDGLIPPSGNGHVLITTQATDWPPHAVVPVAKLSTDAAIDLLVSLAPDDDRGAAEALAAELDRLPLALVQAGSYMSVGKMPIATYLRAYRKNRAVMHQRGQFSGYPHTVSTCWKMAIDRLSLNARTVLNLLSCLAPDAIPVDLLFDPTDPSSVVLPDEVDARVRLLLTDELARLDARAELLSYSLATAADGRDGSVLDIHRLVQAVTFDQLRAQHEAYLWIESAHALLDHASPRQMSDAKSMRTWKSLHVHTHALLLHLRPDQADAFPTRANLAYWTGESGDAVGARNKLRYLSETVTKKLGPQDKQALTIRANLANWTGKAGDPDAARDMLDRLIPDMVETFGPENARVLAARADLAYWIGDTGDPCKARDHLKELLREQQQLLGEDAPDTLITHANLAKWTGKAGDPRMARDLCKTVLDLREEKLGPEHRDTLLAQASLATWTGEAGHVSEALRQFDALLPMFDEHRGLDHPDTLSVRSSHAILTGKAGDAARARKLLADLIPARERVLGAEHPATLATRARFARWTGEAGNAADAARLFRLVLSDQERLLGAHHRDTRETRSNLQFWTSVAQATTWSTLEDPELPIQFEPDPEGRLRPYVDANGFYYDQPEMLTECSRDLRE